MSTTEILFFFLSALAVFSAVMVLVSKNPVHSMLWLIMVFMAISGHYILMNAQFLAIVNLIVYAGAIMVLFLFVIMLMNLNTETEPQKHIWMKFAGVISGGCFL
jgi:NADH-quinone oxidoreductase subunit J